MITVEYLMNKMKELNYPILDDNKPFHLNIIGIRNLNHKVDVFNDKLAVLFKLRGEWTVRIFDCTTDPGMLPLTSPSNIKGTAILVPGRYPVYTIDKHQGKYEALCQRLGPVSVYRDNNRDLKHDFNRATIDTGMFGINIHRANETRRSTVIGRWSEGCQVIPDPTQFEQFMWLCRQSVKHRENRFVYILIEDFI